MTKRRIFAIVFSVLAIALTVFIFSNSLKTADVSQQQSDGIVDTIADILNKVNLHIDAETLSFLVRKCAHFAEYFLLGGLVYASAWLFGSKRPFVVSLLFCFSVILSDEFIAQRITEGRSPEIRDCAIDLCGAVSSSIALYFIRKRYSEM